MRPSGSQLQRKSGFRPYCRNVHGAALVTSDPLPAPVLFVVCVCSWVLLIAFTLIETAKLNKVDPQA
jgi:hypothetical protein